MMSKLRSLLFPANPIPSYSSPSKQMATPFYLLPKSQNSLCLFLLLLMFNPSASAHSSTQQCVDTGLYGLVRVRCRIVRNPVSWLTSRWWLEISHVRDIYTTETKHPPPPHTHPTSRLLGLYQHITGFTYQVCPDLDHFSLSSQHHPGPRHGIIAIASERLFFPSLFASLHSSLNTAARMILSLQRLPVPLRVNPKAPGTLVSPSPLFLPL